MNNKIRNGFLDFLKLLFALIIVIGHGDTIYGSKFPNKIIPLASFCVDFFFLCSGAMLLKSIDKEKEEKNIGEDTTKFLKHKIKGLIPNYYVAWISLFCIINFGNNIKNIILGFLKAVPELLFLDMTGVPVQTYNGNTWYISAMLISILIIYPLIKKNREFFINVLAPIISIFGIGYITNKFQCILVVKEWNGFMYYGLIRGISEMCLGCITYELSKKLKEIKIGKIKKIILTIIECFFYTGTIIMMFSYSFRYYCFVLLFFLMISMSITLSDVSYSKSIFKGKIFNWMGQYSYSLYLGHSIAYAGVFRKLIFGSSFNRFQTLLIFVCSSIIAGLFVMYISKLLLYLYNGYKKKIGYKNIVNKDW